jgi:sodium transport system ATP-binding protein
MRAAMPTACAAPGRAARCARRVQAPDRAREHRYFGELHGLERPTIANARRSCPRRWACRTSSIAAPKGFSQGQRTKTAIARALVHDPQNVILDEPTNGLDVMTTRGLREFLRSCAAKAAA